MNDTSVAYGWRHFDEGMVGRLVARDATVVDTSSAGFVACPLIGHAHGALSWLDASARRGTDWHAEPELRVHASPTFVLRDPFRSIIVGHDLIREPLAGERRQAETQTLKQAVASGRVDAETEL